MDILVVMIAAIGGAGVGAIVAWFSLKSRIELAYQRARHEGAIEEAELAERVKARDQEIHDLQAARSELRTRAESLSAEIDAFRTSNATLEARAERIPVLEKGLVDARERETRLTEEVQRVSSQLASAGQQIRNFQELTQVLERREAELAVARGEATDLKSRISILETTVEQERKQADEKLALLEKARESLTQEFQNLANKIFEEKGEKFAHQNKTNLETILSPLRDQLGDFRKRIEDVYDKESKDRVSLHTQIEHLQRLNQQIGEDAVNLTKALKGGNKTQGNWGEMVLESILEKSGLVNGREYETQASYQDEDGRRRAPDVVVHLPENKDIVIDSKVSLSAYERYVAAETDEERDVALKQHLTSLRAHIKGLSGKKYDDLVGVNTLDFVLLFIPIEPAFLVALQHDSALLADTFDQQILVVSPSTLLVTLRTIHSIWRIEHQNLNAKEIAKRAGDLYDKFVGFVESLEEVGDRLTQARSAYDTAHNRLSSGKGSLVGRVEGLRQLGAKARKQLPANLQVESDSESDLEVDEIIEPA
jgi:DNA recombination protein RmuC